MQVEANIPSSASVSCMTSRRFASRSTGVSGALARKKGIDLTQAFSP
jgi:hypothetical protein